MGGDLLQVQLHGVDAFLVDAGAVACGRIVGVGLGQPREKCGLERRGLFAEDLPRELQYAGRVGNHLHRLNAGEVIEEPAVSWST